MLRNGIPQLLVNLPEGEWKIQLSRGDKVDVWSTAVSVTVPHKHTELLSTDIHVRFPSEKDISCEKSISTEKAAGKLTLLGLKYDVQSLFDAGYSGNIEAVDFFINSGFDLNEKTPNGSTLLMAAVKFPPIESQLIKCGANVNAATTDGQTALIFAAIGGDLRTVSLLIRAGAGVNLKDNHGRTALMYAAESGRANVVKTLLMSGADKNLTDAENRTALDLATMQKKSLETIALLR